jgi:hypothetical protein
MKDKIETPLSLLACIFELDLCAVIWDSSIILSDITLVLNAVQLSDPEAAEELLPLHDDELRILAARKMARGATGQVLQPTALVSEAWQPLFGAEGKTRAVIGFP